MTEKIPTSDTEKITNPTAEEILNEFENFTGGEYTELRKLEDEEGVYYWEVFVMVEGRGFIIYSYTRDGVDIDDNPARSVIDKVFFDLNDVPFHGFPVSKYGEGIWVAVNDDRMGFVHPDIIEGGETPDRYEGSRRECGPEVKEYIALYKETLEQYDIAGLYEILDAAEARESETRKAVMLVCAEFNKRMKTLKAESTITETELAELKSMYKNLSQATGMINSGRVDHTR
jgi:hypothetical protein